MVIEGNGEDQGHDEEQHQDLFVIRSDYQEEKETDEQNEELSGDDVRENCTHKEAIFAFEEGQAVRAMMPDVKRLINYPRFTTRRTTQSQRAPQNLLDLFKIYSQGVRIYYAISKANQKDARAAAQRRSGSRHAAARGAAGLRTQRHGGAAGLRTQRHGGAAGLRTLRRCAVAGAVY